jgi:hypothetical protein
MIHKRTKKYFKDYYKKNKERIRKQASEYRKKTALSFRWERKQIALFIYSKGTMRCSICGYDDIDCLDIDHKNNDGRQQIRINKNIGKCPYFYLQKDNYPEDFDVLCRNCNWKKHLNLNYSVNVIKTDNVKKSFFKSGDKQKTISMDGDEL